jgi:hypothetical protein
MKNNQEKLGPIYEKFVSRSRKSGPFHRVAKSSSIIEQSVSFRRSLDAKLKLTAE